MKTILKSFLLALLVSIVFFLCLVYLGPWADEKGTLAQDNLFAFPTFPSSSPEFTINEVQKNRSSALDIEVRERFWRLEPDGNLTPPNISSQGTTQVEITIY